jgi:krueppel-like family protein
MPQQFNELPEQTEPEDLSMHSPRSPVTLEELEDLDDAATLYLKSQRKHLKIPMLKTPIMES